jgi:hypothetical protein
MAFKGSKKIRKFMQAKFNEHVRPEVQELVKRGNITLEEWTSFRGNSWEFEHMYCALNDEAFAYVVEHNLKNCVRRDRLCLTYDEACTNILTPELLRRFRLTMASRNPEVK